MECAIVYHRIQLDFEEGRVVACRGKAVPVDLNVD
jgi:hypothetical protein